MRPFTRGLVLICVLALAVATTAWASGGNSNSMPRPATEESTRTPDALALDHYNFGISARDKAQKLEEKAAAAANEKARMKLEAKVQKNYVRAIDEFRQATGKKPDFYQAYSDLGYCLRKTHDYTSSLDAYNRALQLEPGYSPAIEYRGEAYLGLNRIDDAKQAYMELFGIDRPEADKLLVAMKDWVGQRRDEPSGVAPDALDAFAGWVDEREEIAGQTASVSQTRPRDW